MLISTGLAGLPPPDELAPLIAILATFLIPIIVILTRHQQKMTLLMRQENQPVLNNNNDILAVQYEIQQLKSMVSTLAMSVDSLKDEVRTSSSLQERVNSGN